LDNEKSRREKKANKTRDKILLSTLEIVGEEGLTALSARSLAERATVSKANLYHHFKNMDEIKEEAILHFLDIIRPPAMKHNYKNLKEFLYQLEEDLIEFMDRNRIVTKGYSQLISNETIRNQNIGIKLKERHLRNIGSVEDKARSLISKSVPEELVKDILLGLAMLREGIHMYVSSYGKRPEYFRIWKKMVNLSIDEIERYGE